MSHLPRIVCVGNQQDRSESILERLRDHFEILHPHSIQAGLSEILDGHTDGIVCLGSSQTAAGVMLQSAGVLEKIPAGVALLDQRLQIIWNNVRFQRLTNNDVTLRGSHFYDAFGSPEILGPDFCPFHTALGSGESAKSSLRVGEKSYFEVDAIPIFEGESTIPGFLMVAVRDVSTEILQRQKLNAIYQAGLELGDLSPQEVFDMTYEERIELLKSKILHFTQDLLEFETVEIRLVERPGDMLKPLLAVGMEEAAMVRQLKASPQGNGVTGFVAATGKSYLCEDTTSDPLYLLGARGARSSLTVPLILHDEILGTFNVESPHPGAFDENDLQFLELFSREVAVALNTLELLNVEKATTATESTQRVLREVAHPVDEIINDVAWVLERHIGQEPSACERLQRVLKHTRDIKQVIQQVGQNITPKVSRATLPARPERPILQNKRVLVVDADETVRAAAHELLGRYGCIVETAHDGEGSFLMVRSFHYDVVLADIRLPDMNGFECFRQLKEINEHLPVILVTGFGYDPTHSIVKARQMGLKSVLYKPFRLDQLITEVEKNIAPPAEEES